MRRLVVAVVAIGLLTCSASAFGAGGLSGKFQTKIASGPMKGTVTLSFLKKNAYTVKVGPGLVSGKDAFSGSMVTFSHEKDSSCKGAGKYKYKLTGKTLKFTKISDACSDRSGVLGHTFKKVS